MKTIKIAFAAACALCLSTTAFAQTTPTTGTMPSNPNTMQNGTMAPQSQSIPGSTTGTMNNGSTNGRMDNKTKMSGHKGMKKSKTSTTPSSTGTM